LTSQKLELEKLSQTINTQTKELKRIRERDFEELKGFEYVASGLSRTVFSKDKYVIKVESNYSLKRYKQNENEWKNYKKIPKHLKKYFVKPLKRDRRYRWIIQEKASCRELDIDKRVDISHQLKDIFDKNKLVVTDVHEDNVGMIQNKPVMLDYGFDEIRRGKY